MFAIAYTTIETEKPMVEKYAMLDDMQKRIQWLVENHDIRALRCGRIETPEETHAAWSVDLSNKIFRYL